jgi:hypothetical protein
MDIMGANSKMAERYQYIMAGLRDDIASRLGNFLWNAE